MNMNEAKLKRTARRIADDILEMGDGEKMCGRIQFMAGTYGKDEEPHGGLSYNGLVEAIEKSLRRHLS